jgi:hypothetical protein
MTKTKNYDNMPITAPALAHRIVNYLQEHGSEVAYSYDEKRKNGV